MWPQSMSDKEYTQKQGLMNWRLAQYLLLAVFESWNLTRIWKAYSIQKVCERVEKSLRGTRPLLSTHSTHDEANFRPSASTLIFQALHTYLLNNFGKCEYRGMHILQKRYLVTFRPAESRKLSLAECKQVDRSYRHKTVQVRGWNHSFCFCTHEAGRHNTHMSSDSSCYLRNSHL